MQFSKSERGNLRLHFEGFSYSRDSYQAGRMYWRCIRHPKCCGRAITHTETQKTTVSRKHNHPPTTAETQSSMQCRETERGNLEMFFGGFLHKRDGQKNGRTYWRCVKNPKCRGRAITYKETKNTIISVKHNHPPTEGTQWPQKDQGCVKKTDATAKRHPQTDASRWRQQRDNNQPEDSYSENDKQKFLETKKGKTEESCSETDDSEEEHEDSGSMGGNEAENVEDDDAMEEEEENEENDSEEDEDEAQFDQHDDQGSSGGREDMEGDGSTRGQDTHQENMSEEDEGTEGDMLDQNTTPVRKRIITFKDTASDSENSYHVVSLSSGDCSDSDQPSRSFGSKIPDRPHSSQRQLRGTAAGPSTSAADEFPAESSALVQDTQTEKKMKGTPQTREVKHSTVKQHGTTPQHSQTTNKKTEDKKQSTEDKKQSREEKQSREDKKQSAEVKKQAKKKRNKRRIESSSESEEESLANPAPSKATATAHSTTPAASVSQRKQGESSSDDSAELDNSAKLDDSAESDDSAGKAAEQHQTESSHGVDETESGPGLASDSKSHASNMKPNATFTRDTSDEEEETPGAQLMESISGVECLLVVPEDQGTFEKLTQEVCGKLAEDFGIQDQHVHTWSSLQPDLLPPGCMVYYFQDIAKALLEKKWDEFEELLLSGSILQSRLETSYMRKMKTCSPQQKELDRKRTTDYLTEARKKNDYLVGLFTCSSSVRYLVLVINNISDPQQNLRHALHRSAVYPWKAGGVSVASFPSLLSTQHQGYRHLECSILGSWFADNVCRRPYSLISLPQDDILKVDSWENSDGLDLLKSTLAAQSSSTSELSVIILISRMNKLIPFEKYLEATVNQYLARDKERVVCVFPVDNLSENQCPQIELSSPECTVHFFSAFDPSQKPVTMLVADVNREAA